MASRDARVSHVLAPLLERLSLEDRQVIADWAEERDQHEVAALYRRWHDPDQVALAELASLGWALTDVHAHVTRLMRELPWRLVRKMNCSVGNARRRRGVGNTYMKFLVERSTVIPGQIPNVFLQDPMFSEPIQYTSDGAEWRAMNPVRTHLATSADASLLPAMGSGWISFMRPTAAAIEAASRLP